MKHEVPAPGAGPLEGSGISEIAPGGFSFHYFNHRPELMAFFGSKGYQGGGYTWEALAKAGLELTGSEQAAMIEFDPEGDALYAYSSSKAALMELDALVRRIATDSDFRDKCIALAAAKGILE